MWDGKEVRTMRNREEIEGAIGIIREGVDEEGRDFDFHRDQEVSSMVIDALRWVLELDSEHFGAELSRYS
jgi:hypothetical protein